MKTCEGCNKYSILIAKYQEPFLTECFKHMSKIGEGIPGIEKLCTARNRKVFNNGFGSFLTLLAKFDCHRQRAISSIAFFLFSPLIHNSNMNYCFAKRVAPAIWSKIESQMQRGRQNAVSNYVSQIWKILTMRRNSSVDSPKHPFSQKMYSLVVNTAQQ